MLINKARVDLTGLEALFTQEEIKNAIFELGAKPDDFLIFFFQKFWLIINNDLIALCQDFHNGAVNLERINWANIVLVPKVKALDYLTDFSPN